MRRLIKMLMLKTGWTRLGDKGGADGGDKEGGESKSKLATL